METKTEGGGGDLRRVIKRYSNRKLYDTKDSRYVTLLQIAEMIRGGEEVQIIDNNTKEDLTEVTLAQIIYEEQKTQGRNVPLQTLKELIHQRTGKVLENLREGPIGRLIPDVAGKSDSSRPGKPDSKPSSLVEHALGTLEDLQHRIDERIRATAGIQEMQEEIASLRERVEELERKLDAESDVRKSPAAAHLKK